MNEEIFENEQPLIDETENGGHGPDAEENEMTDETLSDGADGEECGVEENAESEDGVGADGEDGVFADEDGDGEEDGEREAEEEPLSDYALRKRANDYALIVNAYPWARELGTRVEDFGELFLETMAVNETHMNAVTAFELAFRNEIVSRSRESIRRSERRKMENKAHLKVKGAGSGGNSVTVPKDILKMYRMFNPSLSEGEIRKAYAKEINEN